MKTTDADENSCSNRFAVHAGGRSRSQSPTRAIEGNRPYRLPHTLWLIIAILLPMCWNARADDADAKKNAVQVFGDAKIAAGVKITVSFPTAMVAAGDIGTEAKTPPVKFEPALEAKFLWKSQTEGELTVVKALPGTQFKMIVPKGLADLDGRPVRDAGAEVFTATSEPFIASCDRATGSLPRRPAVWVGFNRPVKASDLPDTAWFQDRDTRKHYPVEVVLEEDQQKADAVMQATLSPKEDLPGGHAFDLIIEGIKETETGTPLQQMEVCPLGETESLKVAKVAAFNFAMEKKRIEVDFDDGQTVDPAEARKIKIEPAVPGVAARADGDSLVFEGDFDITKRYTVTIPADVTDTDGFPMAAESKWGASFRAKAPALIFPGEDLHERSALGLNFSFMQINTGPLEWKLARVPPEKLFAISGRVREFTEERRNPATHDEMLDPKTEYPTWKQTELLIDAAKLEVVAQGKFDASPAEADTLREIRWKPGKALPAGAYVLEVTGKNAQGKIMGN
ncbi:MAG TPA: Ig-like domain-containing protein, partial [Chthoniobacteraceae bacterium]|nr:Ig-like domain-containing protein [Chthoniobacteraceae bacterium]